MKIREFHTEDAAGVIDLWEACHMVSSWNNPIEDVSRKLKINPQDFIVGEIGDRIIASAMLSYDGNWGTIHYIGIHPDIAKNKLGKQFLQYIEDTLKNRGCPKINIMALSGN